MEDRIVLMADAKEKLVDEILTLRERLKKGVSLAL